MLVTYTLNTEKEIIWSLPYSTDTVVTAEDTTKTVDTEKLAEIQTKALANAIRAGKILSDSNPELIFSSEQESKEFVARIQQAAEKQKVQQEQSQLTAKKVESEATDKTRLLTKDIKGLLKSQVSTVKKEILRSVSTTFLNILKVKETDGKNRSSVLMAIDERLKAITEEVTASINDDSQPMSIAQTKSGSGLRYMGETITYDEDVIESDIETIEIKFGYDEE